MTPPIIPHFNLKFPLFLPIAWFWLLSGVTSYAKVDFNQEIRPILSDKCYKCHGPDAKNQKSNFRLDSFEQATKNHDGVIGLTPGQVPMTPFEYMLKDEEISAVLTYVRNSFGNKASPITTDQVAKIRNEYKSKLGLYSPKELLEEHPLEN